MKDVITLDYNFCGAQTPTTAGTAGPDQWKKLITGAAPPTVTGTAAGIALALTADSQAQLAGLTLGDILAHDIDDLIRVDFYASLTASFAETVAFGMASAHNATLESMTAFALFKASGSNSLLVSMDDNVTDTTDIATGFSLGTTLRRYSLDFASGNYAAPGTLAVGGKSNICCMGENTRGQLRTLAPSQRFTMGGYTAGLQPYAVIAKASGTNTGTLTISRITIVKRVG